MTTFTTIELGFLLVNKPAGWTSFDVVGYIRKMGRRQFPEIKNLRVGHAGTLDPFATGLLIVGVGREATRRLDEFKKLSKTYEAVLELGATSNTGDKNGTITSTNFDGEKPSLEKIKKILETSIGKQLQIPPMYSAKKVGGKKLYDLARAGKTIEREPCEIEIYSVELLEYEWPRLKIRVDCGAGTYIRTLAEDIGKKLGCGACCQELTRTRIGEYYLKNAGEIIPCF